MKGEQMEFDLVSPWLGATKPPAVETLENDRAWLTALQARLNYEDSRPLSPITELELEDARFLMGEAEWKNKNWKRAAKRNPRRFRKTLLSITRLFIG